MKPYETLTVCGCEYHFKLTTANAVKLEEKLKTDILSGLGRIAEIKVLADFYFSAGVSLNDNINTIDDVYQMFDDYITDGGSYEDLQKLINDILLTSGILSQQAYDMSKKLSRKQKEKLVEALQNLSK